MLQKTTVAVVGGGSVGISFVAQLIDEAIREKVAGSLEILLFEPQQNVGPGYAYQQDFECNLLNTRADSMSAISGDKEHFLRWLSDKHDVHAVDYPHTKIGADEFLPRSLFGRYLENVAAESAVRAATHGIALHQVRDHVIDVIHLNNGRLCVDTRNEAYLVDRVVLSIGNQAAHNFPHLEANKKFINNPYPTRVIAHEVPKDASVCVLGSGLSAIDAVLSLVEAGHQGRIVMASRNGRLPSVRGTFNKPHVLRHLTRENLSTLAMTNGHVTLSDVFGLLCQEIEAATGARCDIAQIMNADTGVFDYLSSEIRQSELRERLWQSVIYATNGVIDYAWHLLSRDDKKLFQSSLGSLWSSYRVSFPLKNARKLSEVLRRDRVLVLGGVTSCKFNALAGVFETRVHDTRNGFRSVVESDYAINATGYSTATAQSDAPLVRNLLRRKIAVPHEFGGFVLDFESGHLVAPGGWRDEAVSVLGSLAAGTYFWTNAMDVNARLAKGQAENLVRSISARNHEMSVPLVSPRVSVTPPFEGIRRFDHRDQLDSKEQTVLQ